MKIGANDIVDVGIPTTAWRYEYIDDAPCYTIRDPTYANVFWVRLWATTLADCFRMQSIITQMKTLDLTRPVLIFPNTQTLTMGPAEESLVYYARSVPQPTLPWTINLTIKQIKSGGIAILIIVWIVSILTTLLSSRLRNKK